MSVHTHPWPLRWTGNDPPLWVCALVYLGLPALVVAVAVAAAAALCGLRANLTIPS